MDHEAEEATHSAPFIRRLVARLLDLAFALLLTFVAALPVSIVYATVSVVTRTGDALVGFFAGLCYFIAYVALEWFLLVQRGGQTLGKGLLGLRVVRNADAHQPLGVRAAGLRLLLLFIPWVLMSFAGSSDEAGHRAAGWIGTIILIAAFAMAAGNRDRRRTPHDILAGSRVVRAPRRGVSFRTDLRLMVPGQKDVIKDR